MDNKLRNQGKQGDRHEDSSRIQDLKVPDDLKKKSVYDSKLTEGLKAIEKIRRYN